VIILSITQADTGNWYVTVLYRGVRQEFKFAAEPTATDLAFAKAELARQNFPVSGPLDQEIA
jgi:hypothetical protein